MASNDRNSFFGERNMTPSRQQQYSPSFNLDNGNGRQGLRPPPGMSPAPHFVQGNSFVGVGAGGGGMGLANQQQPTYPLMAKNMNGGGNYFNNMVPPPGYAYFTPPQSPHLMNSHSPSPGPNFDPAFHQAFHQGFGQPSLYYGSTENYNHLYDSGAASVHEFSFKDTGAFGTPEHHSLENTQMQMTSDTDSSRVIQPIIENIVGTSSGGTYTHFGPAPTATKMNGMSQTIAGGIITGNAQLRNFDLNAKDHGKWQDAPFLHNEHGKVVGRLSNGDNSKAAVQRPVTPISPALSTKSKNTTPAQEPSRAPQTSAKPSYLEILTKSTKNTEADKKSSAKSYATASEGHPSRGSPTIQSASGTPFVQIHNQVHRKLSDGFVGGSAYNGSVDGASNSSTASSSPIVKPKQSQNSFLKGKENSFSNAKGSPAKSANNNNNSPAFYDTPTKTKANEWTKKVGNGKKNHGKFAGKNINYGNIGGMYNDGIGPITTFDFDIEDLDDEATATEIDNQQDDKLTKKKLGSAEKAKKSQGSIGNGFTNNATSGKSSESKGQANGGSKKARDKTEKPRSRKEGRNCTIRRVQILCAIWLGHLCAALNWLWALLLSVTTLSVSLGCTLCEDAFNWWKTQAVPKFLSNYRYAKQELSKIKSKMKPSEWNFWSTKEPTQPKPETPRDLAELLAMLGPERNIVLPASGEEALQRLLSVKGKDPYSILGVRSDSSDDTIRRYYKKQAVLVHPDKNLVPGAEEAFKILGRAFELVGEPAKRSDYHRQFLEAHAKEQFFGEFGNLFEQLRKKMESVSATIKCTKCNARHKKNRTDRPVFAARYCAQCRIHHAAREGELWAEKKGMFGFWQYYTCMDNVIWEMNEWGKCQRKSLKHLVPDSHGVIYRLVSGTQNGQQGKGAPNGAGAPPEEDLLDPEMDDWDSLIHNLYRATSATSNGAAASHPKGATRNMMNGHGAGTPANGSVNSGYGSSSASSVKKRKGKRK